MRLTLIAALVTLAACNAGDPSRTYVRYPNETPAMAPASLPAFFDCLRERDATIVSAHRGGGRGELPENALRTFSFALAHAPAFLEIDVRAARDGLVLMHDETVDRTTNGQGRVSEMTVAEVQALTLEGFPRGEHPPSLRQALDWADGRTVLELDIKQDAPFEDVVGEVRDAGAMARVIFITYSIDAASRIARLAPEAMIYTTVSNAHELDVLERRGVDLSRIVAWVGTDEPAADLVQALAARGVETRFGMFGEERDYANAARVNAQSVVVDNADEAVRDLDAADGEDGYAALECAVGQSPTGRYDRWISED
jgi:glycerophosphoryl diester phosphodiesterase